MAIIGLHAVRDHCTTLLTFSALSTLATSDAALHPSCCTGQQWSCDYVVSTGSPHTRMHKSSCHFPAFSHDVLCVRSGSPVVEDKPTVNTTPHDSLRFISPNCCCGMPRLHCHALARAPSGHCLSCVSGLLVSVRPRRLVKQSGIHPCSQVFLFNLPSHVTCNMRTRGMSGPLRMCLHGTTLLQVMQGDFSKMRQKHYNMRNALAQYAS